MTTQADVPKATTGLAALDQAVGRIAFNLPQVTDVWS